MIVDVHNHANYCNHGYGQMLEDMDKNGIDITWVLTCEIPLSDWENESANSVSLTQLRISSFGRIKGILL